MHQLSFRTVERGLHPRTTDAWSCSGLFRRIPHKARRGSASLFVSRNNAFLRRARRISDLKELTSPSSHLFSCCFSCGPCADARRIASYSKTASRKLVDLVLRSRQVFATVFASLGRNSRISDQW